MLVWLDTFRLSHGGRLDAELLTASWGRHPTMCWRDPTM